MVVADQKKKGLQKYHGITAGTVTASKALVVDANKDLSSLRNLTVTGTLTAGTISTSGGSLTVTTLTPTNLVFPVGGSIDTDSGTDTATGSGTAGTATVNKMAGKVVTTSMTVTSNNTYVLTVNNSTVTSTDLVLCNVTSYGGTGIPLLLTTTPGSGTITITIYNASASAFNTTAVVTFLVLKA